MKLVLAAVLVSAAIIAGVALFDQWEAGEPFLAEGPPRGGLHFHIRTGLAMILAAVAVGTVQVFRNAAASHPRRPPAFGIGTGAAAGTIAVLACSATVMALDPGLFNALAREDSVVEWLSAVLLLLASAGLFTAAFRLIRAEHGATPVTAAALVLAAIMFLIAMEEVSWMQRVLGIVPPGWLTEMNHQEEMNFHNLATNLAENVYYLGAAVLLVLLPFTGPAVWHWKLTAPFSILVPSRFIAVAGAMTTTLAYEMWNIFWMQAAFFAALLILAIYAVEAWRGGRAAECVIFAAAALVLLLTQGLVLATGENLVRSWDDTEFKELFAAMGLAAFALEASVRFQRKSSTRIGELA